MNREEARYVLSAYRVGGQDAGDPQFREALEMLKIDPELAQWFAEEQALDRKLADKLASFPVPPDLKSKLLAARKIIRPMPWWRKPAWMAAAAAVVMLVSVAGLWLVREDRQTALAGFREAMVRASLNMNRHVEVMNLDLKQAQQWLANHGCNAGVLLPAGLQGYVPKGCRVVEWHGCKVSLLCFGLNGNKHVDVFVIDASDLPGRISAKPEFVAQGEMMTAMWENDGKVYLMAGRLPKSDLNRLL